MVYGVIDIGSNTIRMTIYKVENVKFRVLLHKKDATGLASYVKNGAMSKQGIEKACHVLNKYRMILENFNVQNKYAFATAAFRNISNSREAVDEIEQQTNLKIEVISGEEEGKLSFIGASRLQSLSDGILIDIGGGSTELVIYKKGIYQKALSLQIGSLSAYRDYIVGLHPTIEEKEKIERAVLGKLEQTDDKDFTHAQYKFGYGVGGTVRAVNKLKQNFYQNLQWRNELESKDVYQITEVLMQEREKAPRQLLDVISRIAPYRLRTLMPGLIILNTLLKKYESCLLRVSMSGVREGYLYSKVLSHHT